MSPSGHDEVLDQLALLSADPLGFVMFAFPWGEPGELARERGPEEWQIDLLSAIRDGLLTPGQAIQLATASGHGVGKSALVAWIVLWAISTHEDTRGVVTANTETQLRTKTWAELGKWYRLFIAKQFFTLTATAIYSNEPERERTWRIDMVPWSERNTEAFAGLHNYGKRVLVVFDEASAIPDVIWETTEGALTDQDTEIIWAVFGNPTKNTGRFRDAFQRFANRWRTFRVDSRTVSFTNKDQIARWIEDYGDDSDFVRIRVKGEFPRVGSHQFIPMDIIEAARKRVLEPHPYDPLIMGVDVARFGDNLSVIAIRKGRDAKGIAWERFQGIDTMELAARVTATYLRLRADAVFVDGTGVGGGVVDRLRQLHVPVFDINFGSKADRYLIEGDAALYANKRSEMWGAMREWLRNGAIPDDTELVDELVAPEYTLNRAGEIQLEPKDDMRKRGVASPDRGDALALTFALPVVGHTLAGREGAGDGPRVEAEYDPLAEAA